MDDIAMQAAYAADEALAAGKPKKAEKILVRALRQVTDPGTRQEIEAALRALRYLHGDGS